jgi:aldose 1-epimerase
VALIGLQNEFLRMSVMPSMGGGMTCFDAKPTGQNWQAVFRRSPSSPTDPNQLAFYPLVPWSNRVTPEFVWAGKKHQIQRNRDGEQLPIHGNGWLSSWDVQEVAQDVVALRMTSRDTPFQYEALLTYAITDDALRVSLKVTHFGTHAMLYGLGFHPWIHRCPGTALKTSYQGRWLEDLQTHLPTQRLRAHVPLADHLLPDDRINAVFDGWSGAARVSWPESQLSMEVNASPGLNYFVLYSPGQDADFFCFEPVSHLINAHASPEPLKHGLRVLKPKASWQVSTTFRIHGLKPA